MSLDLYLDELDTSLALGTAGTFIGKNFATTGSTNETLYFQTPVANWRPLFVFKTDGVSDITGEDVAVSTAVGLNFIGTSAATASVGATTGLYTRSTTKKLDANGVPQDNFTSYAINDSSALIGDATDPACNIDFQAELSRAIFGTPLGIDMLTNEAELAADFGTTIETMAGTINSSFADLGGPSLIGDINELSSAKLRVCKKIYQQMRFSHIGRFTLKYQAAVTSTPDFTDGVRCAVSRVPKGSSAPAVATGTTVDVLMSGSSANSDLVIDNIVIRDISDVFLEDDKVIISQVGPADRAYKESTATTIGTATTIAGGAIADGGFQFHHSADDFQINLLRKVTRDAYASAAPPAGSVEYWNGDRSVDGASGAGQMPGGNWTDGELYTLRIDMNGNMPVYTYYKAENGGSATAVEEFTQWTITSPASWPHTFLRGTVDTSVAGKTTLRVTNREYLPFPASETVNPQEAFTAPMYTEVASYTFDGAPGDLATGKVLTPTIDTSHAGATGVQLGSATETIQIDQINSVQHAILNGTLTSDTQLPLQANDVFNLVMKVSNNAAQVNVAGKVLNDIGDTVTRDIKLKIKLSAA